MHRESVYTVIHRKLIIMCWTEKIIIFHWNIHEPNAVCSSNPIWRQRRHNLYIVWCSMCYRFYTTTHHHAIPTWDLTLTATNTRTLTHKVHKHTAGCSVGRVLSVHYSATAAASSCDNAKSIEPPRTTTLQQFVFYRESGVAVVRSLPASQSIYHTQAQQFCSTQSQQSISL